MAWCRECGPIFLVVASLGMLVIGAPAATLGVSVAGHEADRAEDGDWSKHAQLHNITVEEARQDAALVDEARVLQGALQRDFPSEFAGLWIDREPTLKVVVALTKDRSGDVRQLASALLMPYLESRVYRRSLKELEAAAANLATPNVPQAVGINLRTNQIEVEVLGDQLNNVRQQLEGLVPSGLVHIVEATQLPTPVAIYGGLNHQTTCGGLQGTIGFSVKRDTGTLTGVVTAGHLANCGTVNGVTLDFRNEHNTGIADAQWFSSNAAELPQFQFNESGGIRQVRSTRSRASIVVGETICKYGRTTGYECGEVERTNFDVDGPFGGFSAVFIQVRDCAGADLAAPGDSGGPAFFGTAAIGIVTHQGGDIFCDNKMYVNSLSEFLFALDLVMLISTQ